MIRGVAISDLPEELLRQKVLLWLMTELGYPNGLIAVEKNLKDLPFLRGKKVPNRRCDILVFDPSGRPLILIECKGVKLKKKMLQQLLGYNHFIQARCCALINEEELMGWMDGKPTETLPTFEEICYK